MVNTVISKINKQRTLGAAAFLISLSFLSSRVLGLIRDRLLASNFGIGPQTDAYTAAFRIPDLLFTILVSGAFSVAFIPIFVGFLERDKQEEAWRVANIILNIIIIATIGLAVVSFIFTSPLVKVIAPGFGGYRHDITVNLTRIMLITPFLFGISSVFGAIQQSYHRFVFFALSSVFYNLGIIIGILFFSKFFVSPIYGVAWGVVLGTAIQAIAQIFGLIGLGYKYQLVVELWNPAVKKIVKLMIPRSLDLGIDQLNTIVETIIGSRLATGSLASYYYANNLKNVPMGLIGGAIATAAFPTMISAANSKDKSRLPKTIVQNLRLVAFLVIPAAGIAIIMRGYIIRLLFGFGDPTTANLLGWLSGAIVAQSLFFVVARGFYALEDTRTPLLTSIVSIVLNIILSLILSAHFGVSGLAMALSIVGIFELIALLYLLYRKIGQYGLPSIMDGVIKISIASFVMTGALYILIRYFFPLRRIDIGIGALGPKFVFVSGVGVVVYMLVSLALRIPESRYFLRLATKQLKKAFHLHG